MKQQLKLEQEQGLKTFKHSFCFSLQESTTNISILNAGETSYSKGWHSYKPFFSIDGNTWTRVENKGVFEDNVFSFKVPNTATSVCWYPSYNMESLHNFISNNMLEGNTNDYKGISYLKFGNFENKTILILARQHPAESLGSFMLEGIIKAIKEDESILNDYSFLIVPIVNISGVKEANHRYTKDGVDMNRAWYSKYQEIEYLKEIFKEVKNPNIMLDLHADEVSTFNYAYKSSYKNNSDSFYNSLLTGFTLLGETGALKRFVKNLIRHKKLVSFAKPKTAKNYFASLGYDAFTLELSAHINTPKDCELLGYNLIQKLKK